MTRCLGSSKASSRSCGVFEILRLIIAFFRTWTLQCHGEPDHNDQSLFVDRGVKSFILVSTGWGRVLI